MSTNWKVLQWEVVDTTELYMYILFYVKVPCAVPVQLYVRHMS
jgi:hypothetical protein